jgi:hypothetical protein
MFDTRWLIVSPPTTFLRKFTVPGKRLGPDSWHRPLGGGSEIHRGWNSLQYSRRKMRLEDLCDCRVG